MLNNMKTFYWRLFELFVFLSSQCAMLCGDLATATAVSTTTTTWSYCWCWTAQLLITLQSSLSDTLDNTLTLPSYLQSINDAKCTIYNESDKMFKWPSWPCVKIFSYNWYFSRRNIIKSLPNQPIISCQQCLHFTSAWFTAPLTAAASARPSRAAPGSLPAPNTRHSSRAASSCPRPGRGTSVTPVCC